ncbi:lambda-crystallin-like [Mya arenaria]|uniref:lambda-crystallin-like n=1 Tax=Mya arenaria TaxID=6604 RepID=UPI0022E96E94|nr:lambda-crystallin-like [Mya arenaria]
MAEKPSESKKVAIIGSGLIGQNWAMIFAGAGYQPCLFDVDPGQLERALQGTRKHLSEYETKGFLRGSGTANEQADKITGTSSLSECLDGAFYVQECVPENIDLKKKVFAEMDGLVGDKTILASSSSCLCASMIVDGLKHQHNAIVAHPINPPYFVPLVEIVPAPFTSPEVTSSVRKLMEDIGQSPITLRQECLGFALNRIQYACINECWNMYKTGLLSAEDIDKVCTDGLGLRYAFIGPLETMHLNANGIKDYCERYAQGAVNVQKETFQQIPVLYDTETAQKIQEEWTNSLPLDTLPERRVWRDEMLAKLSKLKIEDSKSEKSG